MKKNILLLLVVTLIISCGRNKGEQMLYDYQQKNVKSFNLDLADLDFEIQHVKKVTDIIARDSIKHIKKELAGYWEKNPKQSLVDTLSFKYVKEVINKAITQKEQYSKWHQEALLAAIKYDNHSAELKLKRKKDNVMDEISSYKKTLSEVEKLEIYYNKLTENPDSILMTKYRAKYSFKNPIMNNAKQTFNKIFYTNAAQNKFVSSEDFKKD